LAQIVVVPAGSGGRGPPNIVTGTIVLLVESFSEGGLRLRSICLNSPLILRSYVIGPANSVFDSISANDTLAELKK